MVGVKTSKMMAFIAKTCICSFSKARQDMHADKKKDEKTYRREIGVYSW
jgi:hypothetical protein